ncbi:YceD family protein [Pontixanthobacter aestiaquae]|uniref:DUF177 domain-containing protein n=1 Tax=Pontixanthobacter aestiaquae TaxID=1509367 RepID=A0A844Z6A3_9SPHN|nr:YceD family protein [Pontixanthobacter aestiaquae]MDN3646232.1 YceD family protein [Pontixanthobacter aestiaquae]MXO82776.1 DUF177 domain-containing protein [Pontixanthobacter aestiaquae]
MSESELSRPIKAKALKHEPYLIEASEDERHALSKRFALSQIEHLRADITLTPKGSDIIATGTMEAEWQQICSVSGDDFPVSAKENLHLRFIPQRAIEPSDEEIEVELDDVDEIEFTGDSFDLGEAVAQSLGLLIDPYATGPDAETARKEKGIQIEGEQDGPMAEMLAALKK